MKKNGKHIDDFFKEELGTYTETPPPFVWDNLEKKLDGRKPQPKFPYRRLSYFAMLSLLLFIGITVAKKSGTDTSITTVNNSAKLADNQSTNENNNINKIAETPLPKNDGITATSSGSTDEQPENGIQNANVTATNSNNNSYNSQKTVTDSRKASGRNRQGAPNRFFNKKKNKTTVNLENKSESTYKDNFTKNIENENVVSISNIISDNAASDKNMAANKQEDSVIKLKVPEKSEEKEIIKPKIKRFEAGIKGGIESGFNNDAAKKLVGTPYVQYNISKKFSIMLQPGIKYAELAGKRIGDPRSYYRANPDSNISYLGTIPGFLPDGTALYLTKYAYAQSYDSIVKSYTIGGKYMEYDLPILLKYYVSPTFSVYGGVNLSYSKKISVSENTTVAQSNIKVQDTQISVSYSPTPQASLPASQIIKFTGTPLSNYTGPLYPAQQGYVLKVGYMAGFSYEFADNWLFDGLVQQGTAPVNNQGGYNINTALSATYFRLTLGYKLTGKNQTKK
jgi:hypothetical protein